MDNRETFLTAKIARSTVADKQSVSLSYATFCPAGEEIKDSLWRRSNKSDRHHTLCMEYKLVMIAVKG